MDAQNLLARCSARLDEPGDTDFLESIRLVEREPRDPEGVYRLAELCLERKYDDLWYDATRLAVGLPHDTHRQILHRGAIKRGIGDWSGWLDCEARLFDPAHSIWRSEYWRHILWAKRSWDGNENLADKTIFLIADGSHSDCLQMMRYVPVMSSLADRVVLGVSPELFTFARHNFGPSVTVTFRDVEHSIPFQRYAWLLSCPALLGRPPLFAPLRAPRPMPRTALDPDRLHVGLCWMGRDVELPLDALQPLLSRTNVQWHNLRIDERADGGAGRQFITRQAGPFYTFADTANYIAGLDCVVTVCTDIAYLSGALNVPAWLMLPSGADTVPWYPSMRLVRQPAPGDWISVIDSVSRELDTLAQ